MATLKQYQNAWDWGISWARANYPTTKENFERSAADFTRMHGPVAGGRYRKAVLFMARIMKEKQEKEK